MQDQAEPGQPAGPSDRIVDAGPFGARAATPAERDAVRAVLRWMRRHPRLARWPIARGLHRAAVAESARWSAP